jgi:hypothetical protein
MVRITLSLIFAFLVFNTDAFTQQRQQRMQEGRDRLETLRQVKMIEALGVDEETAARLSVMYNRHQEETRAMMREVDLLIDELEDAIEEGKTDDELQQIRSLIGEKRNTYHVKRMNFFTDAESILSSRQVAKLIVFERNFQRDIRRIMQEAQRERRRIR